MLGWARIPPRTYNIVTGFFPEASPRATWETNPRPLLVCGVRQHPDTGMYFCRIAYGTTQHLDRARPGDLVIGNLSILDGLNLKHPTRFVLHSGAQMQIMPWADEYFRPWTGKLSPILSILPENMVRDVAHTLGSLPDLPQF